MRSSRSKKPGALYLTIAMMLFLDLGCNDTVPSGIGNEVDCADECSLAPPACEGDVLVITTGGDTCDPETSVCSEATTVRTDCAGQSMVCQSGGCVDLCADTLCTSALTCEGDNLVSAETRCDFRTGQCDLVEDETTQNCAAEQKVCQGDACVDLCAEVDCSIPPARCEAQDTLIAFSGEAVCDFRSGECSPVEESITSCHDQLMVCLDGACEDLCDDSVCEIPPAFCMDDLRVVSSGGDVCNFQTGECLDVTSQELDCTLEGRVCRLGNCVVLGGDFDNFGSILSSAVIEFDGTVGEDINDDGTPDNAFGPLLNNLSDLLGDQDINVLLANLIATDTFALGAIWPTLEPGDIADVDDLEFHLLKLDDVDNNTLTRDEYTASLDSYFEGLVPRWPFAGISAGGQVTAGPSEVPVVLALGDTILEVTISNTIVRGDLSEDILGLALSNGTLGGFVSLTNLFQSINAYLQSPNCSCLDLDGPLIDTDLGFGPQSCVGQFETATCEGLGQGICSTLASACVLLVPIFVGQADIDVDENGEADALSVFFNIEMTGTNISGLTP